MTASTAHPLIHQTEGQTGCLDPMRYYQARSGWQFVDLAELWRHRGTIWILGMRDLKVRYRQTLVGVAWAIVQPLTTMVMFTIIFRLLGNSPASAAVPYSVTVFCGLLPWQLFATTLTQCSQSLVANRNLITKVYFPRLTLPLSTLVVGVVDFAIAMMVLVGLMAWHGISPSWSLFALPLFVVLAMLISLACGIWLAALNAIYRDVGFVVPFLLQTGFLASPVVYETSALVPEAWRPIFALNPMVGVLEGFRWSLLGEGAPPWTAVGISFVVVTAVLLSGLHYFRHMERFFADRI